jgi:hypothetical protein
MFKNPFKSNTIRVQLIEAVSNETFGLVKLKPEQLPASFDKATTIHIENEDWVVEKAEPMCSEDFIKKGELILWLKKVISVNPKDIRYSIPSIANELPNLSTGLLFHDFTLTIHEDDWRQTEFLPRDILPTIQEEMKKVEEIIFPKDDPDFDSTLNGFDSIHVRTGINRRLLNIPVTDFLQKVSILQQGNLAVQGYAGFVENGFAFKSSSYTYYGTIGGGTINELCLDFFDSMDDEINSVLTEYNFLLVSWCRGSIAAV